MAIIWHIFIKDCRRLRVLLLLFLFLIGMDLIGNGSAILDSLTTFDSFKMVLVYVALLQMLLAWVIIGQLIHEDPVVDLRAFWLTRPISRWDVLAAKTLFLFVFTVLLPMTFTLISMTDNGFNVSQIIGALPEYIKSRISFLLPCIILASMTRNFGGYAFASVALILGQVFFGKWAHSQYIPSCFWDEINNLLPNPRLQEMILNYSLEESLSLVKMLVNALFGVFLVIHQFISRRTSRTLIWFAVWVIVAFLVSRFWAWDFLDINASRQVPIADSVTIEIDPYDVLQQERSASSCGEPFREKKDVWLYWPISIKGVPPGQYVKPYMVQNARIILPGQIPPLPETNLSEYNDSVHWEDLRIEAIDSLLDIIPNTRIVNFPLMGKEKTIAPLIIMSPEVLERNSSSRGTLIADGVFMVDRWVLEARLPLEQGVRVTTPYKQVAIAGIRTIPDGLSIVIQLKTVSEQHWERSRVILRNRITGEAFAGKVGETMFAWGPVYFPVMTSRVNNGFQEFIFSADDIKRGFVPEITKEWIKEAELIFVELKNIGYFEKRLYVKDLSLRSETMKDYFEKDGIRINFYNTGEQEYESANIFQRKPITARRYYKSGGVNTESTYCSGLKQGMTREYYATGELMYEYFYHQDRLEGKLRKYDKLGQLLFEKNYHKGKLEEPNSASKP